MAAKAFRVLAVGSCAFLLMMLAAGSVSARTQVSINVNIGPPPPVVVAAPPQMLYLPQPGLYVAVGVPYDIFFVGGRYYYLHGDHWFWASGYGGPWVVVPHNHMPPGLVKYKVVQLREYREREYRVYRSQGDHFKGKQFVAKRDHDDDNDQGEDHGNHGKGNNGRGRGKK